MILTTPAIDRLRQRLPKSSISILVSSLCADLVRGHPEVEEVLVLDKKGQHRGLIGTFQLVRQLKKRGFDTALVLHPTVRVHLVLFLAGIPRRIGYHKKMGWLLTHSVLDERHLGHQHEVDNVLDFVDRAPLGVSVPAEERPYRLWMSFSKEADHQIQLQLRNLGVRATDSLVAIHPGASCPSKRWALERFIEVGREISSDHVHRVVVVAGPQDQRLGEELANQIPGAMDFSGKTNLLELASLLKQCRLLISNDSGPVHVAVACGTPVISIFGRNQAGLSPTRWRPIGPHDRYLHKEVGCYVCLAHRCNLGFECLSAISVEEVVAAARGILEASKTKEINIT